MVDHQKNPSGCSLTGQDDVYYEAVATGKHLHPTENETFWVARRFLTDNPALDLPIVQFLATV